MSEEEQLGKLAYETHYSQWLRTTHKFVPWEQLFRVDQCAWIASAKAVAERVLAEVSANEASGA